MGLRRFVLIRHRDVTGVSGIGRVAEGVCFSSGNVVMQWTTNGIHAIVVHKSVDEMLAVHGHNGATTIYWLDAQEEEAHDTNRA